MVLADVASVPLSPWSVVLRNRLLANRPLVTIVAGAVVIIGLVVVSSSRPQLLVDRRHAVDSLAHRVVLGAAQSHLWLEEYLAGDGDATLRVAADVHPAVEEVVEHRRAGLTDMSTGLVVLMATAFGLMAVTVSRYARKLRGFSRRQAASERWFRALVQGASELIGVLDADGRLAYANPALEATFGLSPATQTGRDLFDHVHPEDRERTAEAFAEQLRRPRADDPTVFRCATADGGWRILEANWTNCLDDPAVAGVVVNARDVTEARTGREALATSESLLREAQRISHVGHWQWDVASDRFEWLAEEMYAIHGLSVEEWEATSEAYFDLVAREDRQLARGALEEVLTTGTASAAHRIVRPDGTVRHVRHRGEMVYGDDGEALRVVGTCQDVTDQDELRRALQERVKELTCLAAVRRAVYEMDDPADVCETTAAALASAMRHAHLAVASVELDGRQHRTPGALGEAGERLTAPIMVDGCARGQVGVGYTCGTAMFLPAEHELVQSVATTVALWLERHESSAALEESQARFRRLVDNIPDAVFRYRLGDDEGIDYVSPAVETITGYSAQDFLDDPQLAQSLLAGPDGEKESEAGLAEGSGNDGIVRLTARDGSVRWIEYNIVPVCDEAGNVVAVEGVARDVTERTAAEHALKQRAREQTGLARFGEAALAADGLADLFDLAVTVVTEALPVDAAGVSELHPATGELVVSLGAGWPEGVVGNTRMPVDTGSLAAAALAGDAPVVVPDLTDDGALDAPFLTEHGMVSGMSVVIGGRDGPFGALGAFSRRGQEYPDDQVRFLQTLADILGAAIERTTAESALTRSEWEFRTLAEHLPDIVARYSRDHRYLYVNPPVEALLGMPPAAMIGRSHGELGMSAPFVGVWEAAHERVFASGEPTTVEGDYPGVAGTTHLQSLLIPEFDSHGAVTAAVSLTRDITELRQAEQQRREGLARIVAAQEAERARIGEDIHDDSIQVMTAVGMRLEALKHQVTEAEPLRMVARVEETVRHSIERLRALMFELLPPELDRDGLSATLELYLESTATDGLPLWEVVDTCTHELPTEMRVVLYRIAVEAIVNVRKHAQASRLTVALDEVDGGVRLQVRDDGQGFHTDELTDVGPHHVGTATMRGRAAAARGTVDIHSTPGEGTVVTAWVPCASKTPVAR